MSFQRSEKVPLDLGTNFKSVKFTNDLFGGKPAKFSPHNIMFTTTSCVNINADRILTFKHAETRCQKHSQQFDQNQENVHALDEQQMHTNGKYNLN